MKKGILGFLVGIFVIAVVFVSTVFIMADTHGNTFAGEIKSWFETEETTEIPDDVVDDNVNDEAGDETDENTETTAVITVADGTFNLRVA